MIEDRRQERIGRNRTGLPMWAMRENTSLEHCGLPFWEAAFLLFGHNYKAGETYGLTKTGTKGLQRNFFLFYSLKSLTIIETHILICCVESEQIDCPGKRWQ